MSRICSILLLAVAAIAQSPKHPPPMPAMPTGHGVIEGTVLDAATHEPLKKAQVTIGGPLQSPPIAFTDTAGRFIFRELPAGSYWLSAMKSSYNPAQASFGTEPILQVSLGADETKKGVEIALVPGASIEGRVLNEDGLAVRNCLVTAVQPVYEQGRPNLRPAQGSATNDRGEYRISGVPPGRYYLFTRCHAVLPAPHPLLPRGDPRTPHETYAPRFYGGGLDPATANKLVVAAGAKLEGIDFEIRRVRAAMLSGNITAADPGALPDNVMIILYPVNRLMQNLLQIAGGANAQNGTFQIGPVIPGSYRLVAMGPSDGRPSFAQRAVEIGTQPPEPIELSLSTGVELKGSVQFDTEDHPPLENAAQVFLVPVETVTYMAPPQAEINRDGTFTLAGVVPGHWRLTVNALGGYIKSLSLAGRQVSPYDFQISAGSSGPLHVLMGLKMADLSVSVTGLSTGGHASVIIFPEDLARLGTGLERIMMGGSQIASGGLPPGRYRLLATDAQNPWGLLQKPDLLKAIEGSTQAIDVPEGGRLSVTVELVPREELRLLADKEP